MSDNDQTGSTGSTGPTGPTERIDPIDPVADDPARWFQTETVPPSTVAPSPQKTRLPARFGTILWGVILLTVAAFMVANSVAPLTLDPVTWLIGGLIAVGAVLVIAGIAAAVRKTD